MWLYITRRLLWLPFLLVAASLVTFTLGRFGPGNPVEVALGNRYDPDSAAAKNLASQWGLDKPFAQQYLNYVWNALHGDFGESYRFRGRPVSSLLLSKMWVSFQVNVAALVVSVGIGLPLGFFIAHKQGSWLDPTIVAIALILMSIPIMVSIPAFVWATCLKLDVLPCSGMGRLLGRQNHRPRRHNGNPGRRRTLAPHARQHPRRHGTGLHPHRLLQGTLARPGGLSPRLQERHDTHNNRTSLHHGRHIRHQLHRRTALREYPDSAISPSNPSGTETTPSSWP